MNMKRYYLLILLLFILTGSVFAQSSTGMNRYRKHSLPYKYDPYFITKFENCQESDFTDWTGTYRYIVIGKEKNFCHFKTQYNPWLKFNKNEWSDFKECFFNDAQMTELSNALKEEGYKKEREVNTYAVGQYRITGTKVEYLLTSYEYYGACKLLNKKTYVKTPRQ